MMPASDFIECSFCQGSLEPKAGKQKCPECGVKLEIDDRLESIFAYTSDLRLPIHGTVNHDSSQIKRLSVLSADGSIKSTTKYITVFMKPST